MKTPFSPAPSQTHPKPPHRKH
ncbi:unnamed protein product [Spirodela intermedia]|uniref:Uncharacterized protein n=2 Tax=Spirodela intermedia TaxID=51605 RepID=A0A7I8J3X0_SPIIN|nr:unnamed protein product [Spirodela intermedia]CAA6664081.1 unnamed protein product [Spirodela intermedia]CAA7400604.1 unnamed protein product [Spirodela intermedia]